MQETRGNLWVEMENNTQSHFHFKWVPLSRGVNFERLSHSFMQMANHIEGHHEVSTKNELFKNVKDYFDERNLNAFNVMPITFYIKVPTERADESLKKLLSPFKQVYNLLDEFKSLFDADSNTKEATLSTSPRVETTKPEEEA